MPLSVWVPSGLQLRGGRSYAAEMENLDRLFGVVLDAAAARGNSVVSSAGIRTAVARSFFSRVG